MKVAAYHAVRALEATLPPPLTRTALLPAAELTRYRERAIRAELLQGLKRLPATWIEGRNLSSELHAERRAYHATRFVNFWPDRYPCTRWQARFTFTGIEALQAAHAQSCPVVLATVHAGRMHLLHLALRSRGLPVTMLIDQRHRVESPVKRRTDFLSNGNEPPVVYMVDELKLALKGLQTGNCLTVALDKPSEQMLHVNFGGVAAHFSTGAIRMAHRAKAQLYPALVLETAPWQFRVWVGPSVDTDSTQEALQNLSRQIASELKAYPLQCGGELLKALA